eukprot:3778009-Prymnesium_polylepis.1
MTAPKKTSLSAAIRNGCVAGRACPITTALSVSRHQAGAARPASRPAVSSLSVTATRTSSRVLVSYM